MKKHRRILSLSLALTIFLCLAAPALATPVMTPEGTITMSDQGSTLTVTGVLFPEEVTIPVEEGQTMTVTVFHVSASSEMTVYNGSAEEMWPTIGFYDLEEIADHGFVGGYGDVLCELAPGETWHGLAEVSDRYMFSEVYLMNDPEDTFYFIEDDGKLDLSAYVEDAMAQYAAYDALPKAYERTLTTKLKGIEYGLAFLKARALKDANGNETNYVSIRELAKEMTQKQAAERYNVTWENNAIHLQTKTDYVAPEGGDDYVYLPSEALYTTEVPAIFVDGREVTLEGIVLTDDNGGGHTYYKLRDLGAALGFGVDWSAEEGVFLTCTPKQ